MQNIKATGTKPELIIMMGLRKRKIYFAKHVKTILGKPDIVFRRKKVLVFIDSDFWHGHPVRLKMPKTNIEYWTKKIEGNKNRDQLITRQLRKTGWKVIRIWDYDIKKNPNKSLGIILTAIGYLA